jgi:hypothetical protein
MADLFAPPTDKELMSPPSKEEINLFAPPTEDELFAPPSKEELETPSKLESAGLGTAQGLTFNFADELEAAVRSLAPGETYEDAVAKVRERYKRAEKANPKSYLAGEVAGSIGGAFVPGIGAIGTAAKGANLGRVALAGATQGALAGAGSGEGLEDTVKETATGALIGAGLGAGIGVAGKALRKGAGATLEKVAPKTQVDIGGKVEELYRPLAAKDQTFASDLYANKLAGEIEPSLQDDIRSFAKYLDGERVKFDKALDVVNDYKGKLSPEDFVNRYQDYKKLELAKRVVADSIPPESSFARGLRTITNKFVDGMYAARNIDVRNKTNVAGTLLDGTAATNRYQIDLADQLVKVRPIYDRLRDIDDSGKERIYRAIDEGGISKLAPEEKEIATELGNFYKNIKEHLTSKLGVPVQDLAKRAEDGGYIPHKLVEPAKAVSVLRGKYEEWGGDGGLRKILANDEAPEHADLKKTLGYFGYTVDEGDPVKFFKGLLEPGSAQWKKERLASALYQRKDVLPNFLKERDIETLTTKYLMETLRYGHSKDVLRQLAYERDLLRTAGAAEDAAYLDNLVSDYLGVARKDGKTTPAQFTQDAMQAFQVKMYDNARKAKKDSVKNAFYEKVAHSPDNIKNLFMNVYPNFLGWSPRAAIQNLTGGLYTSVPELGAIYGTKAAVSAVANASKNLATNPRAYLKEMQSKGLIAPQWTTDLLDTFRKGGQSKLGKLTDKSSAAAMALFEASEKYNRAILYETGKMLAKDYAANDRAARRFIETMPPRMREKLDKLGAQQQEDLIVRYLGDRVLFSYNKLNQSEFARSIGPLFSMFTKYPFAVAGRLTDKYRNEGVKVGLLDSFRFAIAPYLAGSAFNELIQEDTPDWVFGKQDDRRWLGQGIASSSPVGAVQSIVEGRVFRSPALGTVSSGATALLQGDPEKLEKWAKDTAAAFAPGGANAWLRLYEGLTGDE